MVISFASEMIPAIAQTAHDRNDCPMLQSGWFVWSSSSFWKCARVPWYWWLATFFLLWPIAAPLKNDRQNSGDRLVVEPSDRCWNLKDSQSAWIVQWYCQCVATHCCLHAGLLRDKMTSDKLGHHGVDNCHGDHGFEMFERLLCHVPVNQLAIFLVNSRCLLV